MSFKVYGKGEFEIASQHRLIKLIHSSENNEINFCKSNLCELSICIREFIWHSKSILYGEWNNQKCTFGYDKINLSFVDEFDEYVAPLIEGSNVINFKFNTSWRVSFCFN